ENPGLRVIVESVDDRVAGHEIIRRELRFDIRLGNDPADANIHSCENLRDINVDVDHRHIEPVVAVMLDQLIAEEAARDHETVIEAVDAGDAKTPVDVI